ncbi:MAG: preprotein translocase subunit SecG [Proteobacteria bacterium]|nr:preprotein translocase subunit SecG [Pseudomonadota bacterium]MDA1355781.1 preprotein translocase subunit SecG [Pseudomonadota bacterium]
METILLVILVIVAVTMIGAVLLQRSEGGALGIGGGGPGAMFSARGSANFLTRMTAGLGAVFMILSLVLAILSRNSDEGLSVMDTSTTPVEQNSNELQPFDSEDYDPDALDSGSAPTVVETDALEGVPESKAPIPESDLQSGDSDQPSVPSPD